jgi:hypothetical protein
LLQLLWPPPFERDSVPLSYTAFLRKHDEPRSVWTREEASSASLLSELQRAKVIGPSPVSSARSYHTAASKVWRRVSDRPTSQEDVPVMEVVHLPEPAPTLALAVAVSSSAVADPVKAASSPPRRTLVKRKRAAIRLECEINFFL